VLEADLPDELTMTVRGNLPSDVVEHVFVAALAEGLRRWTEARVTPVNARLVAGEQGMLIHVMHDDWTPPRGVSSPTGAEFAFETQGEAQHHVSVRWEHGQAGIVEVDRFSLDRPLEGDVLITHHRDKPGLIGRVGMILGGYEVNIAGMQVGRHHRGGHAIMVLNVDDAIPPQALLDILAIEDVQTAYVVSLPSPAPVNGTLLREPVTVGGR
jgi:D-3-phosphoglycerate dehydrogenase